MQSASTKSASKLRKNRNAERSSSGRKKTFLLPPNKTAAFAHASLLSAGPPKVIFLTYISTGSSYLCGNHFYRKYVLNMIRLFIFPLLLSLLACGQNTSHGSTEEKAPTDLQAVESARWDDVMKLHDKVMPLMGELNRLKREVAGQLEQQPDLDEASRQQGEAIIAALEEADEGMMEWMYEFKQLEVLQRKLDHEGILAYLQEEEQRIGAVEQQFATSMGQAEEWLAAVK